jgi:hypothetical protein
MKAILTAFILVVVTINTASADLVPFGCYVTDTERYYFFNRYGENVSCYASSDGEYKYTGSFAATKNQLISFYGSFVTKTILDGDALYLLYEKQANLNKRLRRACGSKCKRIK